MSGILLQENDLTYYITMALKDLYEKWSDDKRVLFVRWVITIFAIGVVTTGWNLYQNIKSGQKVESLRSEKDTLAAQVSRQNNELTVLKRQIESLQESQYRFNFLEDQFAMPRVLKSVDGVAFAVNDSYYKDYMEPYGFVKSDYEGKKDEDFWGERLAKQFAELERIARVTGRPVTIDAEIQLPFAKKARINPTVTVAPLYDRYRRLIAYEVTIAKFYRQ